MSTSLRELGDRGHDSKADFITGGRLQVGEIELPDTHRNPCCVAQVGVVDTHCGRRP